MRWIVGLDLRERSHGALAFATWLAARARSETMVGVHVVEERELPLSNPDAVDRIMGAARERTLAALEAHGAREAIRDPEVTLGRTAEDTLTAALSAHGADGLIVGRRAASGEHPIVRLGRVARRLVRRLPAPTLVVPPDLDASAIGDGGVLVAIDGTDSSAGACTVGQHLARALGRELVLVHAMGMPTTIGTDDLPPATLEHWRASFERDRRPQIEAWMRRHALTETRLELDDAPVALALLSAAARERACMVVTGARRLGALERLFATGVGVDLAAAAPFPVLIAPAPEQAAP